MLAIGVIITLTYVLIIGSLIYGFGKITPFKLKKSVSKTSFSVIIPFRNEAQNLPSLLKSISKLDYPKHLYEIILVDDDSEDDSVKIIHHILESSRWQENFQAKVKVIKNDRKTNSPKKDAITSAIDVAQNEWIITTDADCQLPEFWLNSFDAFIQQTNAKCIVAPVAYHDDSNFLNKFQILDFLSLQGATMGGFGIHKPFLCNGANFGYKKTVFQSLNGFEGNSTIASGDDIFLLEKIVTSYPKETHYLKCEDAVVITKPQHSWQALCSQRIRWAAKTSAYNNGFGKLTGLVVLLMNGFLILTGIFYITHMLSTNVLLCVWTLKFSVDFLLIYKAASFFNQRPVLRNYLGAFIVYPIFNVYVAIASLFSGYSWKSRRFKK